MEVHAHPYAHACMFELTKCTQTFMAYSQPLGGQFFGESSFFNAFTCPVRETKIARLSMGCFHSSGAQFSVGAGHFWDDKRVAIVGDEVNKRHVMPQERGLVKVPASASGAFRLLGGLNCEPFASKHESP